MQNTYMYIATTRPIHQLENEYREIEQATIHLLIEYGPTHRIRNRERGKIVSIVLE